MYDVHNGPESNFNPPEIVACTGSWVNMITNFPFEKVDFSNMITMIIYLLDIMVKQLMWLKKEKWKKENL